MRYFRFIFLVVLVACSTNRITDISLSSPDQLVGSYRVTSYGAAGSLDLKADSTFTLTVNVYPWSSIHGGTWTWASGNVLLKPSNLSGSIQASGLQFTPSGYQALYFRKQGMN